MFGGDDPFGFGMFGHMQRHMQQMDRMMDAMMMDPFGFGGPPPVSRAMLEGPPPPRRRRPADEVMDLGYGHPFAPFGHMGGIFNAMNNLQERAMSDPNAHVYMQSTMMTFDDQGRPRVVEKSTRRAGDVREDRRRVRDAELEEMEIGHTIGNRTHVIEKKRDKDGIIRSQQRFVNMDEADAHNFDREFNNRARSNMFGGRLTSNQHALEGNGSTSSGASSASSSRYSSSRADARRRDTDGPIITLPEEEEEGPHRRGGARDNAGTSSSSYRGGPIIREISEEEAESSIPKRRKGGYF